MPGVHQQVGLGGSGSLVTDTSPSLGGDLTLNSHKIVGTMALSPGVINRDIPTTDARFHYRETFYSDPTVNKGNTHAGNALFTDADGSMTFNPAINATTVAGTTTITGTTNDLGDMRVGGVPGGAKMARTDQWKWYKLVWKRAGVVQGTTYVKSYNAGTFKITCPDMGGNPLTTDTITLSMDTNDWLWGVNTGAGGSQIDATQPGMYINMEQFYQPTTAPGSVVLDSYGGEYHHWNFYSPGLGVVVRCMTSSFLADGPNNPGGTPWAFFMANYQYYTWNILQNDGSSHPTLIMQQNAWTIGYSATECPVFNFQLKGGAIITQPDTGGTIRNLPYILTANTKTNVCIDGVMTLTVGADDAANPRVEIDRVNCVQHYVAGEANPRVVFSYNGVLLTDASSTVFGAMMRANGGNAKLEFCMKNSSSTPTVRGYLHYLGNWVFGNGSSLATSATDGFVHLTGGAGIPTGTPANGQTGSIPTYADSTNSRLFFNPSASAWRDVKQPVGVTKSSAFDMSASSSAAGDVADVVYCDTSSAGFTVTLPDATRFGAGRTILLQKIGGDANTLTVARSNSQTINGSATSQTTSTAYGSIEVTSNGSNWLLSRAKV